jgi:Na+-driven multidrug efflux pump
VAFANTLARAIALIVIAIQLQRSKAAISFRGRKVKDFKCLGSILKIGIPGGVSNLSYSFSQIVSTSILALVGTMAISAKIYISSIVFYVYVVGYSLGMSSSILMGWMTGAKEFDKAERLNKMLLKFTIILNPSLSALIFIFHKPLLSLFTKNPEIIAMGASVFFIDIFVEFGRAFNHIEDYSLRGTGDVLVPMLVNMSSCWFMSILFSYILGVHFKMGLNGCWIAFMMDECFRGLVLFIRFKSGKWKQKHV